MTEPDAEERDEDYLTRRIYDAVRLVFLHQASGPLRSVHQETLLTVQDLGRWSATCRSFARKWKGENEVWFQLCQQRQWTDAESLALMRPVLDRGSSASLFEEPTASTMLNWTIEEGGTRRVSIKKIETNECLWRGVFRKRWLVEKAWEYGRKVRGTQVLEHIRKEVVHPENDEVKQTLPSPPHHRTSLFSPTAGKHADTTTSPAGQEAATPPMTIERTTGVSEKMHALALVENETLYGGGMDGSIRVYDLRQNPPCLTDIFPHQAPPLSLTPLTSARPMSAHHRQFFHHHVPSSIASPVSPASATATTTPPTDAASPISPEPAEKKPIETSILSLHYHAPTSLLLSGDAKGFLTIRHQINGAMVIPPLRAHRDGIVSIAVVDVNASLRHLMGPLQGATDVGDGEHARKHRPPTASHDTKHHLNEAKGKLHKSPLHPPLSAPVATSSPSLLSTEPAYLVVTSGMDGVLKCWHLQWQSEDVPAPPAPPTTVPETAGPHRSSSRSPSRLSNLLTRRSSDAAEYEVVNEIPKARPFSVIGALRPQTAPSLSRAGSLTSLKSAVAPTSSVERHRPPLPAIPSQQVLHAVPSKLKMPEPSPSHRGSLTTSKRKTLLFELLVGAKLDGISSYCLSVVQEEQDTYLFVGGTDRVLRCVGLRSLLRFAKQKQLMHGSPLHHNKKEEHVPVLAQTEALHDSILATSSLSLSCSPDALFVTMSTVDGYLKGVHLSQHEVIKQARKEEALKEEPPVLVKQWQFTDMFSHKSKTRLYKAVQMRLSHHQPDRIQILAAGWDAIVTVFAFSLPQRELNHMFTIPVGQGPLLTLSLNLTHIVTASAGAATKPPKEGEEEEASHTSASQSLVHLWEIGYGY